jgi:hypothetical protein
MKKIFITILVLLASLLSAQTKVIVELMYSEVVSEVKTLPSGQVERTVKNYGNSTVDLQIRDVLMRRLGRSDFRVVSPGEAFDWKIIINPVLFRTAEEIQFSVDLLVKDASGKRLFSRLERGTTRNRNYSADISNQIIEYLVTKN